MSEERDARRAARREAAEKARAEQHEKDLDALDALEEEHGDSNLARLDIEQHVSGQPTLIVLRKPSSVVYKRFVDQVSKAVEKNNAKARRDAQDLLADSCWIYPATPEERAAMIEHFPGIKVSIAIRANQLVEAKAAEEGKD